MAYRPWIVKSAQLALAMLLLLFVGCSQKAPPPSTSDMTTPEENMSGENGDMPLAPVDMSPGEDMSMSPTADMSDGPDLMETPDMDTADAGMDSGVDMTTDPDMGEVSGGATGVVRGLESSIVGGVSNFVDGDNASSFGGEPNGLRLERQRWFRELRDRGSRERFRRT